MKENSLHNDTELLRIAVEAAHGIKALIGKLEIEEGKIDEQMEARLIAHVYKALDKTKQAIEPLDITTVTAILNHNIAVIDQRSRDIAAASEMASATLENARNEVRGLHTKVEAAVRRGVKTGEEEISSLVEASVKQLHVTAQQVIQELQKKNVPPVSSNSSRPATSSDAVVPSGQ